MSTTKRTSAEAVIYAAMVPNNAGFAMMADSPPSKNTVLKAVDEAPTQELADTIRNAPIFAEYFTSSGSVGGKPFVAGDSKAIKPQQAKGAATASVNTTVGDDINGRLAEGDRLFKTAAGSGVLLICTDDLTIAEIVGRLMADRDDDDEFADGSRLAG